MDAQNLHHAYALEGDKLIILPELMKFLEKEIGVISENNPDFSYQDFETFSIDNARDLQEMHLRRAVGTKKIFIISTRFITVEAQNALLKMLEEPTPNTHFFIILPNAHTLLPTLLSRVVTIKNRTEVGTNDLNDITKLAKKFLAESTANRLLIVKNIIEEKDKGKAIDFVTALEIELAKKPKDHTKELEEVLTVKKYLNDRAPSIKLLLEHLCLFI